jgi:glycosyltransferase involved in cell wall biosynthesis
MYRFFLKKIAILASHPVQYYAPLFRVLAHEVDVTVFYAHQPTPEGQAIGFGEAFAWDIDLLSGYPSVFLPNVARNPGTHHFRGCDTPEIGRHLREGRFDAVLALGWHLKSMLQGIWAAKRLGIPVMIRGDSHLGTPRSGLKKMVKAIGYPPLLRLFDAALYVGERNRDYYRHYGYPEARLFSSPHCVDTERFARDATPAARHALRHALGISAQAPVVLFAGKLVPFKRPFDVIEAAAVLRQRGTPVQVMIAGSGILEAELAARAKALAVPLHLLGFQNQSRMPAVYAAADVLVLPSDARETWGLVCNEALACGTPVVVSDQVGSARDLAQFEPAARVFPLTDFQTLADRLQQAFVVPRSNPALAHATARYSLTEAAGGILAAMTSIART